MGSSGPQRQARLDAYVATFLFRNADVLLMRRASDRRFAANLWAGVGGRLEDEDAGSLTAAALREIREETGIRPDDVRDLSLRVVLTQPEQDRVVVLAFFTATATTERVGETPEGTLRWVSVDSVWDLDMIANARSALSEILRQGQTGEPTVRYGVCEPDASGALGRVTFENAVNVAAGQS